MTPFLEGSSSAKSLTFQMSSPDPAETTLLLSKAARGDDVARGTLTTLTYNRLREIAAGYLSRERPGHTLEPTALVHEAYLRLLGQSNVDWKDRAYFLALAAREMRRILIDHARAKKRRKRRGSRVRLDMSLLPLPTDKLKIDVLDLDEAIRKLSEQYNGGQSP